MTVAQIESRYGPVVARVNSKSQPDKVYEVRRRPDDVMSCNCKGWIFNRSLPKHCIHTDAVAMSSGAMVRKKEIVRRAGIGVKKDLASTIIEKILDVGGLVCLPGAQARMACALRPYLMAADQDVRPQPGLDATTILSQGARLITLDD